MKVKLSFLVLFLFVLSACQKENLSGLEPMSATDDIAMKNADKPLPVLSKADNNLVAVYIHWGDDTNDPVAGANVFDRETHEVLGKTDENGFVYVEVEDVAKLISIDPNYGEQQTLINYPGDFTYSSILDKDIIVVNWPGQGPNWDVIHVFWGREPMDFVVGANVFDVQTQELVARTNEKGDAILFNPEPGSVFRVVDPVYGEQQAILKYPSDFNFNEELQVLVAPVSWSIPN